jgi:hypothetical protein
MRYELAILLVWLAFSLGYWLGFKVATPRDQRPSFRARRREAQRRSKRYENENGKLP